MKYRVTPQPPVPGEQNGRVFSSLNKAKAWTTAELRKQLKWANKFAHDGIEPIGNLIGDVNAINEAHFDAEPVLYHGALIDPHTNTRALFVFERLEAA